MIGCTRWDVCPRCQLRRESQPAESQEQPTKDRIDHLLEYFDASITPGGAVRIEYGCRCEYCGFEYEVKHKAQVDLSAGDEEPKTWRTLSLGSLLVDAACTEGVDYYKSIGCPSALTAEQIEALLNIDSYYWLWAHKRCYEGFESLPDGMRVKGDLYLYDSRLTTLPNRLTVEGMLLLNGCRRLTSLPPDLTVHGQINLTGTAITEVPATFRWKTTGKDVAYIEEPK